MEPRPLPKAPKLGGILPDPKDLATAIQFSNIRKKGHNIPLAVLADPALLTAPSAVDNQSVLPQWQVLGNDTYGDCNAVAWANIRRLVSAKLGRRELYPNQDQVIQFYKTQNPNFPDEDHGMSIVTGLNYLIENGGPDGVKPLAYVNVNPQNLDDVKAAIATFGYLWLGCTVVQENLGQFHSGQPWTVNPVSTLYQDGKHVVMAAGYDSSSQIKFVTWGGLATFSTEYWNGITSVLHPAYATMITQAWAVIWPEHLGTRRFWAGVDTQQLNEEYQRIYYRRSNNGQLINFPTAPSDSLWLIQTTNTANIKLHRASAAESYATEDMIATTPLSPADAPNGTFVFESGDLYFIKTASTGTKTIEVHRLTNASEYENFDMEQGTIYPLSEADNGPFTIDNGDLYHIKTRNTNSGFVELHSVNHEVTYLMSNKMFPQGNFFSYNLQTATPFTFDDAANGCFVVRGGDLYYIRTHNTASGKIELSVSDGEQNYTNRRTYITCLGSIPWGQEIGSYSIDNNGNLYFVWTTNTGCGKVQIFVVLAETGYQSDRAYGTPFADYIRAPPAPGPFSVG